MKPYFIIYLIFSCFLSVVYNLNIALHAQVSPSNSNQIVGSVITTDGLKNALLKRSEVDTVEVFYPSEYAGYLDTTWDLVVIEGWFSSINEFIQLSRNSFPGVSIVYFCLDPTYPPLTSLLTFDVDGILSNSAELLSRVDNSVYKRLLLLAADSDLMKPNSTVQRDYGAVYVGAGGGMLAHKPGLHSALIQALPYRLRLHGFSWDHVDQLSAAWLGVLPRYDLSAAYASAHVVIAFTIASQSAFGMINNRIFEALSCGAVVVSDYSTALAALLTNRGTDLLDLVLFVNETHSMQRHLEEVMSDQQHFDEVRRQGREFVLERHTWQHRAVSLLSFFEEIQLRQKTNDDDFCGSARTRCLRHTCPRLLWVASDPLVSHSDYASVLASSGREQLCRTYRVDRMSGSEWIARVSSDLDSALGFLSRYDVVLNVVSAFDSLDLSASLLPTLQVTGKDRLQKRACYLLGVDGRAVAEHFSRSAESASAHFTTNYDVVLFRSHFEIALLRRMGVQFADLRLQHAFGVGKVTDGRITAVTQRSAETPSTLHVVPSTQHIVIVCFIQQHKLCGSGVRNRIRAGQQTEGDRTALLLVGGDWEDWLALSIPSLSELAHTVHVPEGHWSSSAVRLIQSATRVFLQHRALDDPLLTDLDALLEACSDSLLSAHDCVSTTEDVFWPFIAAAAGGTNAPKLHFYASNANLLRALDYPVENWDDQHFQSTLRLGLDRLHGFGVASARVWAEQLVLLQQSRSQGGLVCENCDDSHDEWLLRSNYLRWLDSRHSDDAVHPHALLRLNLRDFTVGRDGECCLSYWTDSPVDNRVCMLRPFHYVLVKVLLSPSLSSIVQLENGAFGTFNELPPRQVTVNVSLSLRGSFFSDVTAVHNLLVHVPGPSIEQEAGFGEEPSDIDYDFLNTVFIYEVRV